MTQALPTDAESLRELSQMAMQDGDEGRGYQLYWAAEAVASDSPYAPVLMELIGERDKMLREAAKRDKALTKAREALRPLSGCVFNDNGDMTVDMLSITHDERIVAYFAASALDAILKGGG